VLAWPRYAVVLSILTSSTCVCADKQASKSEEEKKVAEAQFKALGEAYEVLSCPEKKQRCVSA
jgi:predicted helicase